MAVLIDTSVVIDCLRQLPIAQTYFQRLTERPAISVVTIAEIYAGVRRRSQEEEAALFFKHFNAHRIDASIAQRAGAFVRLYRASHAVELSDAVIAATAERHGLALATLNVKHFPMFARLAAPYRAPGPIRLLKPVGRPWSARTPSDKAR